eukprot:jgi/Psemu1/285307/fgenesh1_pg.81_\
MESVENCLELKDGRFLAYHTFPKAEEDDSENPTEEKTDETQSHPQTQPQPQPQPSENSRDQNKNKEQQRHPVLYFHGFPGCGLEGGFSCALAVAREGGRLYGIDRPGMGKTSSPYADRDSNVSVSPEKQSKSKSKSSEDSADPTVSAALNNNDSKTTSSSSSSSSNIEIFVESVWELVENQGWTEFSIIGVSGGGPYALAMIASYLQRKRNRGTTTTTGTGGTGTGKRSACCCPARLRNVSLVGAICVSAGSEGIKTGAESLIATVESAPTSRLSRFGLRAMSVSTGAMFNLMVPMLPISWVMYLNSFGTKDMPAADRAWMSDENNLGSFLSVLEPMAVQGGYPGIYDDMMIIFAPGPRHEEIIREHYSNSNSNSSNGDRTDLPAVGIFQGGSDVNVPLSHAKFLHSSIFHERSEFFQYDDLGHVSLVAGKAEEYSAFATAERNI